VKESSITTSSCLIRKKAKPEPIAKQFYNLREKMRVTLAQARQAFTAALLLAGWAAAHGMVGRGEGNHEEVRSLDVTSEVSFDEVLGKISELGGGTAQKTPDGGVKPPGFVPNEVVDPGDTGIIPINNSGFTATPTQTPTATPTETPTSTPTSAPTAPNITANATVGPRCTGENGVCQAFNTSVACLTGTGFSANCTWNEGSESVANAMNSTVDALGGKELMEVAKADVTLNDRKVLQEIAESSAAECGKGSYMTRRRQKGLCLTCPTGRYNSIEDKTTAWDNTKKVDLCPGTEKQDVFCESDCYDTNTRTPTAVPTKIPTRVIDPPTKTNNVICGLGRYITRRRNSGKCNICPAGKTNSIPDKLYAKDNSLIDDCPGDANSNKFCPSDCVNSPTPTPTVMPTMPFCGVGYYVTRRRNLGSCEKCPRGRTNLIPNKRFAQDNNKFDKCPMWDKSKFCASDCHVVPQVPTIQSWKLVSGYENNRDTTCRVVSNGGECINVLTDTLQEPFDVDSRLVDMAHFGSIKKQVLEGTNSSALDELVNTSRSLCMGAAALHNEYKGADEGIFSNTVSFCPPVNGTNRTCAVPGRCCIRRCTVCNAFNCKWDNTHGGADVYEKIYSSKPRTAVAPLPEPAIPNPWREVAAVDRSMDTTCPKTQSGCSVLPHALQNIESCQAACDLDPSCNSFSYCSERDGRTCPIAGTCCKRFCKTCLVNDCKLEVRKPIDAWEVWTKLKPGTDQSDIKMPYKKPALYCPAANVFLTDLQNLRTKMSSQEYPEHGPELVIDGSRSHVWDERHCTMTANDTKSWWMVDLTQKKKIDSVNVFGSSNQIDNFKFEHLEVTVGDNPDPTNNPMCSFGTEMTPGVEEGPYNFDITGKSTDQSTTQFGGISSHAVDGDINPSWSGKSCTGTMVEAAPYWRVDLGAEYTVASVQVFGRDTGMSRMSPFSVRIGNKYGTGEYGSDNDPRIPGPCRNEIVEPGPPPTLLGQPIPTSTPTASPTSNVTETCDYECGLGQNKIRNGGVTTVECSGTLEGGRRGRYLVITPEKTGTMLSLCEVKIKTLEEQPMSKRVYCGSAEGRYIGIVNMTSNTQLCDVAVAAWGAPPPPPVFADPGQNQFAKAAISIAEKTIDAYKKAKHAREGKNVLAKLHRKEVNATNAALRISEELLKKQSFFTETYDNDAILDSVLLNVTLSPIYYDDLQMGSFPAMLKVIKHTCTSL